MNSLQSFDSAVDTLPFGLRQLALALPKQKQMHVEEFRLRTGYPVSIMIKGQEEELSGSPRISINDLRLVLDIATNASVHAALERVRQGYITVKGGHRIGLCGSVICRDGEVYNLKYLSSLNIRIARQVTGIGDNVLHQLYEDESFPSVLILAPPGAGKTTLLRDLIRGISSGVCGRALRVGVADERGEVGAMWEGVPQMNLGPQTDIVDGCSKADGILMLLRGMNPQVLAMDEITAPKDVHALTTAVGCGVSILATAHGSSKTDLIRRPLYRSLIQQGKIQKILIIRNDNGVRSYHLEDNLC